MAKELSANWNYPTNIAFGAGRIKELPQICADLGIKKSLLITDEGLKDFAIVKNAASIAKADIFANVKGNPTGKNVEDGVNAYKAGGYDGIIALGGGSALDAAKAVGLMVGQERPLWDFEDVGDNWQRVITEKMADVIAIPTTAGTGSEVGRASVITNEKSHEKKIIFHPNMLPKRVILDPELTIDLPPHLTAATGIDAFVHAFEAFCAESYHPMADGIALEAMRMIKEFLPEAYANGKDVEARGQMLVASSMGATAFQKGLGAVHALAHPLGALYDKHHGLLNAILLPYVMIKNKTAIDSKMQYLAKLFGLKDESFNSVLDWVLEFRKQLEIPHSLANIGIDKKDADMIAEMAHRDPSAGGNPIDLSVEEYKEIFINAVNGNLENLNNAA